MSLERRVRVLENNRSHKCVEKMSKMSNGWAPMHKSEIFLHRFALQMEATEKCAMWMRRLFLHNSEGIY